MTKNVIQKAYDSFLNYFRNLRRGEVAKDEEEARKIPKWVLNQLISTRSAVYHSEIRGFTISNSGSGPSIPSQPQENVRPYGIPLEVQGAAEDVWNLILEQVTDPKDIINLSKTCEMFRYILRRKYVQARLPEILEICLAHRKEDLLVPDPPPPARIVDQDGDDDEDDDEDIIAPTSPILRLRLNTRLITKITKKAMEDLIDRKKKPEEWETQPDIPKICLNTLQRIQDFAGQLEEENIQNDGMFFPHTLVIEGTFLRNPEAEVSTILQRIGRSIRKFMYVNYAAPRNYEGLYNSLLSWLEITPNLEELEIRCSSSDAIAIKILDDRKFPTIPTLTTFRDHFTIPINLSVRILEANPTIRILDLERLAWAYPRSHTFFPVEVLQSLQLEEWSCMRAPPKELLQSRFRFQWPLRKLTLVDYFGRGEPTLSTDLFRFVNQFQTLEDLHLRLVVDDVGGVLDLPNLRNFGWTIQRSFKNLDFILPLGKLENLHCSIEDYKAAYNRYNDPPYYFSRDEIQAEREEIIQFFRGLKDSNFRYTNLKTVFPRLRSIKIKRDFTPEQIYYF